MSILQRLLVCAPFSRLSLSVQTFSADSESWWFTCGPSHEGAIVTAENGGPAMTAGGRKLSAAALAKSEHERAITKGYPALSRPDVSRVARVHRPEGVDGRRLLREARAERDAALLSGDDEMDRASALSLAGVSVLHPIEVDDAAWTERHLTKWDAVAEHEMAGGGDLACAVCSGEIADSSDHLAFALCPSSGACTAVAHLACLSRHFLAHEAAAAPASASLTASGGARASATAQPQPPLLPDQGACPTCSTPLRWGDIVRGCYRRKANEADGGAARAKRRRREVRLRDTLAAHREALSSGSDLEEFEPKPNAAAVARAAKAAERRAAAARRKKERLSASASGSEAGSGADSEPVKKKKRGRGKTAPAGETITVTVVKRTTAPASSKSASTKAAAAANSKGKGKGKAVSAEPAIEQRPDSDSEASERFDFDTDEDVVASNSALKVGPPKAASQTAGRKKDSFSPAVAGDRREAKDKDKGKARAVSLSDLSSLSDDDSDLYGDGSDGEEASDEERALAFHAAAEGSLEMQAEDLSLGDGSDGESESDLPRLPGQKPDLPEKDKGKGRAKTRLASSDDDSDIDVVPVIRQASKWSLDSPGPTLPALASSSSTSMSTSPTKRRKAAVRPPTSGGLEVTPEKKLRPNAVASRKEVIDISDSD